MLVHCAWDVHFIIGLDDATPEAEKKLRIHEAIANHLDQMKDRVGLMEVAIRDDGEMDPDYGKVGVIDLIDTPASLLYAQQHEGAPSAPMLQPGPIGLQ